MEKLYNALNWHNGETEGNQLMKYIFHCIIALVWLHWKIKYQYNSHLFASVPRITMNFVVSNADWYK